MILLGDAIGLVERHLKAQAAELSQFPGMGDLSFLIIHDRTRELPFGWLFYYNSDKYLKTGDRRFRLIGNGPLIVNRMTGEIWPCGTGQPAEEYIAEYAARIAGGQ